MILAQRSQCPGRSCQVNYRYAQKYSDRWNHLHVFGAKRKPHYCHLKKGLLPRLDRGLAVHANVPVVGCIAESQLKNQTRGEILRWQTRDLAPSDLTRFSL